MGQSEISNEPEIHQPIETVSAGYEGLVRIENGTECRLYLMVRGAYCAACIQKIEGAVKKHGAVTNARLNFSTGRLLVEWRGTAELANIFVQDIEAQGYSVHPYDVEAEESAQKSEERFLLLCLGVAGFALGNIMLLSVGLWSTTQETMGMATRDFLHWISALIGVPAILFCGRPFFRSAIKALRSGHANMDVPISLALLLAGSMSIFGTVTHSEHIYFDSAVMLMFFLLIGRYLDFRARKAARAGASELLATMSGFASVVEDGKLRRIAVKDITEGMVLRLAAGEKMPVDGVVCDGKSDLDTSLITGETLPRPIGVGDDIWAGTINLTASLLVEVRKSADDSVLAEIIRLMEKAEQGQAKYVRLADRAARLYTPLVHTLASVAFILWFGFLGAEWPEALMIAITLLIITCPCALGLAVPVVQVLASSKLMKSGVLVKSGDALERLAVCDAVIMDKTGTLTLGRPVLRGEYDEQVLAKAASLASHSAHPLSNSLARAYHGEYSDLDQVQEIPGSGVQAILGGKTMRLGKHSWCAPDVNASEDQYMELWFDGGEGAPQRFIFEDELRDDSALVIGGLKSAGLKVVMATGDRREVARNVALQCGIDKYYAEQTPPEKYKILEGLKAAGAKVLMVGDGMNDAPVLSGADVSMAPGSAIDIAQNAADIVFMGDQLSPILNTIKTARLTQRLVRQNFALAILYNCIAIPFAFAGMVTPLAAALAMSGSSLVVIANSFRLKLFS